MGGTSRTFSDRKAVRNFSVVVLVPYNQHVAWILAVARSLLCIGVNAFLRATERLQNRMGRR